MKIKEAEDFESIREIWNPLLRKNMFGNNIFFTWEWLSIWWKHFGEKRKLMVLTAEEENEVLAIAPLMLSKYRLPGFGTIRKIEFLGTRHSDYNNFIISKKENECIRHMLDYLYETEDWDWIELKEMPENINYSKQLFADSSLKLDIKERVCNLCPYVALPKTFESLKKTFSRNLRQNLSRYSRKIQENHNVDLKRFDEAGFSVKEAMDIFVRLHELKWKSEGKPGAFVEDSFRNFHVDVAESLAQNGWLTLYFLMADDEPVSCQYNFMYEQKMYYYLAGFLPQYSSYSVGTLTIMLILKRCIESGLNEYDFMRGDEAYKTMWTNKFRRNFEIRLVPKNIQSRFYNWVTWSRPLSNFAEKLHLSLKKNDVC